MHHDDHEGTRRRERWLVSGRVQGVGFRWFVADAARRLELAGDVRNLPDGRVEVRVAGPARALAALARDVGSGPPSARVSGVQRAELAEDPGLVTPFTIRH